MFEYDNSQYTTFMYTVEVSTILYMVKNHFIESYYLILKY